MAMRTAISPKIQPLVRRAAQSHGIRPMTVLSKESAEEYKKQVRVSTTVQRVKNDALHCRNICGESTICGRLKILKDERFIPLPNCLLILLHFVAPCFFIPLQSHCNRIVRIQHLIQCKNYRIIRNE